MIKITKIKKDIVIIQDKEKKIIDFIQDEVVIFQSGAKGIILLAENNFAIVGMLSSTGEFDISVGMTAKKTGEQFKIYPSNSLLGMVVNYLGEPITPIKYDSKGTFTKGKKGFPVDVNDVKMTKRDNINEAFMSGMFGIDVFIPFGKGQRELVIGDKNTGKTTIALSFIKQNYSDPKAIFIYNAIGKTKGEVYRVIDFLNKNNLTKKTIIVATFIEDSEIAQYYSPYLATAIAEYYRVNSKKDAFIIYDDLIKQADAYRSLCIQMGITPGRESFPGDIFYAHSRLLERSGKFKDGTSISSICICETIEEDTSSYIPTNIISITDGQIVTSKEKFNLNIFPAINYGKSVSRVGRSAQFEIVRKSQNNLQFLLANYYTLEEKFIFAESQTELQQSSAYKGFILSSILQQGKDVLYNAKDVFLLILLINEGVFKTIYDKNNLQELVVYLFNKVKTDDRFIKAFESLDVNDSNNLDGFKKIISIEIKTLISLWLRNKHKNNENKYNEIIEAYQGFNFLK
ncbi:F0F1 ATP synthase subunit alpha [Mycoplasma marinum]|uniref:F0F1 ATP synthase subunit alpha n=1 Tax=Mycoplasma marinum TaxID=1937190 RepID=A0A4R0XT90_9MOLU|nr:F0F1 ATP synthase subunit alpha [Mycoplasma marinum]TCG11693.1 F0F1 ATP synthase subunit alpha [Mycoplasma marinum]